MPDYPSRNRRLNESFNRNYKIKVASKYCNKFNLKLNLQSATKKKGVRGILGQIRKGSG